MQPETREMLDKIDEFLMQDTHTSRELWNVLTALRGPDNDSDHVKEHTTAVIRTAAFPKTARIVNEHPYHMISSIFRPIAMFDLLEMTSNHFALHIRDAAVAFGLIDFRWQKKKENK